MKLRKLQRVALYLFLFSINFEMWDPLNTQGIFSISKLMGYIYLLSILPQLSFFLNLKTFKKYIWPYLFFFVLLTVVNFLNINNISGRFIDLTMLQNIILVIILVNHSRKEKDVLVKAMLAFALGSILVSVFFIMGMGVGHDPTGRVTIFGDNQNVIGVKECIGITVLLIVVLQNRLNFGRWRYWLLAAIPLMFLLMIKTGSRTAFIAFTLIFIIWLLLRKSKHGYTKVFFIVTGVGLSVLVWQYMSSNPSDILYSRLIRTENSGDIGGRDRVWDKVIPFAAKHWIIGKGETGYTAFATHVFGDFYSPHNVIIEVICYSGIIGLFFYLLFLFRIFKLSYKRYKFDGVMLQLLLLVPILGLLLSGQLLNVKIAYIIFALVISSTYSINQKMYEKHALKKQKEILLA